MKDTIEKACSLSKKLLDQINEYCASYTNMDGKDITSESSIQELQIILEEGFALNNYLIEKDLYKDKPGIEASLINLRKFSDSLIINKENAEKLKLSNAIQVWNQAKIAIAILADNVLNYYEKA